MAKYKLIAGGVIHTQTNQNIPEDIGNRHWQDYLEWAKTNTADPLDPPPLKEPSDFQVVKRMFEDKGLATDLDFTNTKNTLKGELNP